MCLKTSLLPSTPQIQCSHYQKAESLEGMHIWFQQPKSLFFVLKPGVVKVTQALGKANLGSSPPHSTTSPAVWPSQVDYASLSSLNVKWEQLEEIMVYYLLSS